MKKTNGLVIPQTRQSQKIIRYPSSKVIEEDEREDFELGRKPMICRFLPPNYETAKSEVQEI